MTQPLDKITYTRPISQRGLSLIELMISITIGLLILVSLSTLFINQSKTRTELDKSNRMIDNGRYAIELLSSSLRLAGYYGELNPANAIPAITLPGALPDPCDPASAAIAAALSLHVQGVNATTTSTPAFPTRCATLATSSSITLQPGSDILVIRRASTTTITPAAAAALVGDDTTYLQVSSCPADTPNNYTIAIPPGPWPLLTKDCATLATKAMLRPFLVQVYFVSRNNNETVSVAGCPHTGDCIPTLKRMELDPTGLTNTFVVTPLVEGIEYMQLDYGIDGYANDGVTASGTIDGVADSYSTTCTGCTTDAQRANYWSNVVSIKINLLARNQQSTNGWNDSKTYNLGVDGTVGPKGDPYKRHAYTQLVRLVNPAGRRETP